MSPADRETSERLLRLSHDLRACLRSMRPHAELLLKRGEAASRAEDEKPLQFIVDGTRKLDLLVDSLASYAVALQTERSKFQVTPLEAVLRGVLMKLDKELRDGGAEVTYDKLPRVPGDPDRLGQVFEILLRSCLFRVRETAPRIHVGVERRADGWRLSIRDNGPGIEDGDLERIFRPFEAGLGLATCRVIVERHGGRLWAAANTGPGATILFALPGE